MDFKDMTPTEVTHFFALRLKEIYENRTAGDFTFVGVLYEYQMTMASK